MRPTETSWNKPSSMSSQTSEMSRLYQEIIVEHSKFPRFKGAQPGCRFCQEGKNPLCGDEVRVFVKLGSESTALTPPKLFTHFEGHGCSISQASASMMCSAVQGLTPNEARSVIKKAEDIYSGKTSPKNEDEFEDDLDALSGVGQFPVRVKCAALPWKSLQLLLDERFDERGVLREQNSETPLQCIETCRKKLKIVSTES